MQDFLNYIKGESTQNDMNQDSKMAFRDAEPTDLEFIYNSTLKYLASRAKNFDQIPKPIFYRDFAKVIDHVLQKSKTLVACDKDLSKLIFGYVVFEPESLHFMYIKSAFREFNVAQSLVDHAFQDKAFSLSVSTPITRRIQRERLNTIYNPFNLFKGV